jgi:heptaprenyl diphosphate synthase
MNELPIPAALAPDLRRVQQVIAERLKPRPIVDQIATPHTAIGGTERPHAALVLLAAQIGDYDISRTLHAAAAIELIAAATSLHGGLVDAEARRRDAVGGWPGIDSNVPLMVGDYLLALAAAEMALTPDPRIIAYYSRSVMAFCEATLAPVRGPDPESALAQYLEGAGRSAASLCESACRAGAICGGLGLEQVDLLGRYGHDLGLALAIHQDVSDLQGGHGSKPRAGTITLPLIYAAMAAGSHVSAQNEQETAQQSRGVARALEDAQMHAARAHGHLMGLPESPARDRLAAIAHALGAVA